MTNINEIEEIYERTVQSIQGMFDKYPISDFEEVIIRSGLQRIKNLHRDLSRGYNREYEDKSAEYFADGLANFYPTTGDTVLELLELASELGGLDGGKAVFDKMDQLTKKVHFLRKKLNRANNDLRRCGALAGDCKTCRYVGKDDICAERFQTVACDPSSLQRRCWSWRGDGDED